MARKGRGLKPGRKPTYTPEKMGRLREAFLVHSSVRMACRYAEIDESCFYDWLARGQTGDPHDEAYRDFATQVETFRNEAKLHSLRNIKLQAAKDWRAETWLLAKRYRDEFGDGVHQVALTDPAGTADYTAALVQAISPDTQAQHLAQFIALAQAGALTIPPLSTPDGDSDSPAI